MTTSPSDPPLPADRLRVDSVENTVTLSAYYFFGLIFLVIGGLVAWNGGWFGVLPGLVFMLIGGILFGGAYWAGLSMERFGEVWLEVKTPVYPGGVLEARVMCPKGAAGATSFQAELNCKEVYRVTQGEGIRELVIWSERTLFPVALENGKAHCDVRFVMPADAPISAPGVYWEVQVDGEVEGVDLVRGFRFPVVAAPFGVALQAAAPRMASYVPPPPSDEVSAESTGRELGRAFAAMLGGRRRRG